MRDPNIEFTVTGAKQALRKAFTNRSMISGVASHVSNGIAWTTNEFPPSWLNSFKGLGKGDYCTMAIVGKDAEGRKIGISAAHCISHEPDGAVVREWVPGFSQRQRIGVIAHRNAELDYVVIHLDNDVHISCNGPALVIDHLGPANPTGVVCKDGQTTGKKCGLVTSQTETRIYNLAVIFSGDSGGPLMKDDGWVGINRAFTSSSGTEYVKAAAVLADIEAQSNSVGKGFTVCGTP